MDGRLRDSRSGEARFTQPTLNILSLLRMKWHRIRNECLLLASFQNAKLCRSDAVVLAVVSRARRHKFSTPSFPRPCFEGHPSHSPPATLFAGVKFVLPL